MSEFNPGSWSAPTATAGEKRSDIQWFKLEDGQSADIRLLTPNPKKVWVHRIVVNGKRYPAACLGFKDCPAPHEKGKNATPRYAVVVVDRRDSQVKIWEMNDRTYRTLVPIVRKKGDPTQYDLYVSRTGKGASDTIYTLILGDNIAPLSDGEKALEQPNLEDYYKPNLERMTKLLKGEVPQRKTEEAQASA